EAIQRDRISYITLVPTQIEDLLREPNLGAYDLSSLRAVMAIGDALRPQTAKMALEFFTSQGAEFRGGGFGCTEGPGANHVPGEPPEIFERSVGKPQAGDHWKVIDEQERELPPNAEGELVAKGPGVFTGYYRSEAENRAVFTRDGYFKLGDLGKIDEQGFVFITGRQKDVIQRGGEGVVPGEIERLIDRHPLVQASAVVAMPDQRLGEKACAYVVTKPGAMLSLDELVSFLKGLGAGMLLLPERLELVEALPTTSVGKIDKRALRGDIERKVNRQQATGNRA
ncbi:MAG: long-chain fatty acid--CoA ligase, partial [Chloroflexota bacterium]|nr:long-chain fatty acid--CoA ligase [Chloroflexota bacterium]